MTADEPSARLSPATGHLATVGLTVLGLLITHESAYALATWLRPLVGGDGGGLIDHGHQSLLVAAAGPLALWLTVWFLLRQVRRLGVTTTWSARRLSAVIAALYLIQESIEIVAAGPAGPGLGGLIGNRAVVIGVVLTPIVAGLLLRMLSRAGELIEAWFVARFLESPVAPEPIIRPTALSVPAGVDHDIVDPRGPPVRDVTTSQTIDT